MRLLLVTNDYPPRPGGIQRYLADLVRSWPGEMRVLAPAGPPRPEVRRGPRGFLWPTRRVGDWIEAEVEIYRPDVVVFGAPFPLAPLGLRLRRRTGVPFAVMTYGADLTVPARIPILRRMVLRPLRRADVVLALSRFTERIARRLTDRPVAYLGCGVDLGTFHPPRERSWENPVVVGCVSRFVTRKGQDRLLRAVDRVRRNGHDLQVMLVGAGPREGLLRRLAAELAVPTRFEADVSWERLPGLYREMDLFAMPVRSRWFGLEAEGLGIVYLEAAATGLPVVVGRSGGAPETVRPGETGFLAGAGEELVEALELLLGNPDRARGMGERGRELMARQYTWRAVTERLGAALEVVVSGRTE